MQYNENGYSYGQLVIGCFITHARLMHHNVPNHASCLVQGSVAKNQITQVIQPPYSLDLAPCDFWLFPKLKSPLKGTIFQTINEIQENLTRKLMAIPTKDFAGYFEQWKRLWESCVKS